MLQWAGMSESLQRTPLFDAHVSAGARIVPFSGWEMPMQYAGVVAEVNATREGIGVFDVSHMGRATFNGPGALDFFSYVLASDPTTLENGKGQYSLMCNESGGVIDDVIVYRRSSESFSLVFNAGNRDKDWAHLTEEAKNFDVTPTNISGETCLIAVQGPKAIELLGEAAESLPRFGIGDAQLFDIPVVLMRTGYTGEDGAEVQCATSDAPALWDALVRAGAAPCGLGARDALRVESALPLYGHEMDESVSPYAARLGWVVKLDKPGDFVGKSALSAAKLREPNRLVGVTLEGRGIPREQYPVFAPGGAEPCGFVTSGTFSPTLQKGVAMARVPMSLIKMGTPLEVEIRGQRHPAKVTALPFYKNV